MAKKRGPASGPPPHAQKWFQEHSRGMHQGRAPTSAHQTSIWDASFIPQRCKPATSELIAEVEERLGVVIPKRMKEQLQIQNGGCLLQCNEFPFHDSSVHWTNATVDGIHQIQSWSRAEDNNWFESVEDVKGLDRLIIIAAHSESQLCLDYRKSGGRRMPAVTFIDVCMNPTEVTMIAKTVDEFVCTLIASRSVM